MIGRPPRSTLFPYTTHCRSSTCRSSTSGSTTPTTQTTRRPRSRPSLCWNGSATVTRSEEHTSELQSRQYLVCRPLLEKNNYDRFLVVVPAIPICCPLRDHTA